MTASADNRLIEYLGHIINAIERCNEYVDDMDEVSFLNDRKTQDAMIRTFEVTPLVCAMPWHTAISK